MAACRLPPRARLLPLLLAALCSAAIVSGQVPPGLPGPPPPLRRPWFATDLEELLAAARGRSPVGLPVGWLNTTFASNPTPGNDAASADNRDAALPQPAVSWPWRSEYRWGVGGGGALDVACTTLHKEVACSTTISSAAYSHTCWRGGAVYLQAVVSHKTVTRFTSGSTVRDALGHCTTLQVSSVQLHH